MNPTPSTYCLDANVLIQAWTDYYNPQVCPDYWSVLKQLGQNGVIFLPEAVGEEILRTQDELSRWLKDSKIPVRKVNEQVTLCLKKMYEVNPDHYRLVDNLKHRSLADPWVIAHAMAENAVVVTKESKTNAVSNKRIKIPDVCENMKVPCMNDFHFIKTLNIRFSCFIQPLNS